MAELLERFPDLSDDELTVALAVSWLERNELRRALAVADRRQLALAVEKTRRTIRTEEAS